MHHQTSSPFEPSNFLSVPTDAHNNKLSPHPSPHSSHFHICDQQTNSGTNYQNIESYITYSDTSYTPKGEFDFLLNLPYSPDTSTSFYGNNEAKIGLGNSAFIFPDSSSSLVEEDSEKPIEEEKTQTGLERASNVNSKNQTIPKMSKKEQVAIRSKAKHLFENNLPNYRKGAGKPRTSRSQSKSKRRLEQEEDLEEVKRDFVMKSLKGNSGQVVEIAHSVVTSDLPAKPKASIQNKMKNIPGLIAHRVKRCCLLCISIKKKDLVNTNRKHIYTPLTKRMIPGESRMGFIKFLKGFKSIWKTWEKFIDYFGQNVYYAEIFLECILQFLGPEGDEDFKEWLTKSRRLCPKNLELIVENKKDFQERFELILKEVQGDFKHV